MQYVGKRGGFTLIELMIVIAIIAIIAAIAIPNMLEARKAGNETGAIGSLKAICSSQFMFRDKDPDNDGTQDFAANIGELAAVSFIDAAIASGTKSGYAFVTAQGTLDPGSTFWATANPSAPGTTGDRYFAINLGGVVHYTTTAPLVPVPATAAMPANAVPVGG